MKRFIPTLLFALVATHASAQVITIIRNYRFEDKPVLPPDYLVRGDDGTLYGMNSHALYRWQPDGSGFTILKQFPIDATSLEYFIGRPALSGNTLYGALRSLNVFKINTDGTGYTVLKDDVLSGNPSVWFRVFYAVVPPGVVLSGDTLYGWGFKINTDGTGYTELAGFPDWDGLQDWHLDIQVSGNKIFGATARDGIYGAGTLFSLNTDGTGYNVLHDIPTEEQSNAEDYLTLVGDMLYGVGNGGVFKLKTDGTGYTALKEDFTSNGEYLAGRRLEHSDGFLFGTTVSSTNNQATWAVFKMNTNGTDFTVLKSFTQSVTVLAVAGGTIYGNAGTPSGAEALFKMSTDGTGFAVLQEFIEPDYFPDGVHPGPLAVSDRMLCGVDHNEEGFPRLYKMNTDGTGFTVFEMVERIFENSRPTLSGSTVFGVQNGRGILGTNIEPDISVGTIFRMNTDGTDYSVLKEFIWPAEQAPNTGLALSASTLYGTAGSLQIRGGIDIDSGKIFKLNTDGTAYAVLHAFTLPNIDTISGMWTNSDGIIGGRESELTASGTTLYGTTFSGGKFGYGTVFKLNTDGNGFTVLRHFSYQQADYPASRLLLSGDTLYGTSGFYGNGSDSGSVFRLKTDGTGFTILKQFSELVGISNSDGAIPQLGGIWGNTLYGTTIAGGNFGLGTVFKINTDGTGFAVIAHVGDSDHQGNSNLFQHSLVQWGNTLFGSAEAGGDKRVGAIYRIDLEPKLSIGRTVSGDMAVSWPSVWSDYVLQQNVNGLSSLNWSNVTYAILNDGTNKTIIVDPTDGARLYRLKLQ